MTTVLVATVDDFPPEVIAGWKEDGTYDRLIEAGALLPPTVRVDMVERAFFNPNHDKAGRFAPKAGIDPRPPVNWDGGLESWSQMDEAELNRANEWAMTREDIDMDTLENPDGLMKAYVASQLADKMRGDPDWNALVEKEMFTGPFPGNRDADTRRYYEEETASKLIKSWATTSTDDNMTSLQLQAAARREFKLQGTSDYVEKAIRREAHINDDLGGGPGSDWTPSQKRGAEKFMRAQYDLTQATLARNGVTSLPLFRGVHGDLGIPETPGIVTAKLNPLSSFSSNFYDAENFAMSEVTSPRVLAGVIPASKILSTPFSGNGCRREHEAVVLGGTTKIYSASPISGQTDQWGTKIGKTPDAYAMEWWGTVGEAAGYAEADVFDIDDDLALADWTKQTWDLPTDIEGLRAFLASIGMTVEHFMTLPVYKLNVDKLPWLRDLGGPMVRAMFNPNHDPHSGRFAPGGAGAGAGAGGADTPSAYWQEHPPGWLNSIEDWHTRTKEDVLAGKVEGVKAGDTVRDEVAAHARDQDITVNPDSITAFPDGKMSTYLFSHEAGHYLANEIQRQDGEMSIAELEPFKRPGGRGYVSPWDEFAPLSDYVHEPGEILADTYAHLLNSTNDFDDPSDPRIPLLGRVARVARSVGAPDKQLWKSVNDGHNNYVTVRADGPVRSFAGIVVRSMFNPRHDPHTGRFAPKPATVIGITPNRGKTKQTIAETEPYYGSSRYKNFRHHAAADAPKGVTVLSNERASGFWMGDLEPSAQVVVKGGRPEAVKAYATGLGKRFNQDGVVAFTPRKGGIQRLYRWKTDNPDGAVEALRKAGVMGASVHGGRVEVIDIFGTEGPKMKGLGTLLGHKGQIVRGDGVLWEKGTDYAAIMTVKVVDLRSWD